MLQTRSAKRPAQAAVRVAVDMVGGGTVTKEEALRRVDAGSLEALLRPAFDPAYKYKPLVTRRGRVARRGKGGDRVHGRRRRPRRRGRQGGDARAAVHRGGRRRRVPSGEGHPHLRGREGVARGARRARAWAGHAWRARRRSRSTWTSETVQRERHATLHAGDLIAIDGTTGRVTTEDVPLAHPRSASTSRRCSTGPTRYARLGVRANADTPEDARRAATSGAEGIGLCRTEHMFMEADRQPKMQTMILAEDERSAAGRARRAASAPAARTSRASSRRWAACR